MSTLCIKAAKLKSTSNKKQRKIVNGKKYLRKKSISIILNSISTQQNIFRHIHYGM